MNLKPEYIPNIFGQVLAWLDKIHDYQINRLPVENHN